MRHHPWLARLLDGADLPDHGRPLAGAADEIDGVPVQVVELTGSPGRPDLKRVVPGLPAPGAGIAVLIPLGITTAHYRVALTLFHAAIVMACCSCCWRLSRSWSKNADEPICASRQ